MNNIPKLPDWISIPMLERQLRGLTPLWRAAVEVMIDSTGYSAYHVVQAAEALQKIESGEDFPLIWNNLVRNLSCIYINLKKGG